MPRKKKSAREMTTEELAKRIFPKKVLDHVKKKVEEQGGDATSSSSHE